MSIYKRWSASLSSALWLVLTVTIWIVFAPLQAGGQAAYIVVIGKSMEPNFHLGDMIIVKQETHYDTGDIVAYKNIQLKSNVFHRIIGFESGRYILKGDNNTWVDTYHPLPEEVIGKLWVYLPGAGKIIQRIRTPLNMALIVGVFAGLFLFNTMKMKEKPKGGIYMKKSFRERINDLTSRLKFGSRIPQHNLASNPNPQPVSDLPETLNQASSPLKKQPPELFGGSIEIIFFALGLVAFVCLILGITSLARPLTVSEPNDVNYQHIGIFSYSASAPSGLYDSNTVQRGEPIFPKVTCAMRVDFHYTLFGDNLKDITGTYNVTAQILDVQSGWQRTVTLLPETLFAENSFDTSTTVDLCEMVKLTTGMEQEIEYFPSQYTLSILPHLTIAGQVDGRDLEDTYEPRLVFKYDRVNFSILQSDTQPDPYNQSQARSIREINERPNTISLFGLRPQVLTLRLVSLIGLVLSLIGMWLLERYIQSFTSKSPQTAIQMKYSTMFIDIQSGSMDQSSRIVNVNSLDDLAKLAERYNAVIMHESREEEHAYFVTTNGTTYRFSSGKNAHQIAGELQK
jgi:signal peptidase I